jgi:aminoglycoside phosphotransferase (APT) family kinase protein
MPVESDEFRGRLAGFVRHFYGPLAEIRHVEGLSGHSGLSVGFDVVLPRSSYQRLVIRLAPRAGPGVLDMARQARLMAAVAPLGVKVPRVLWYGDGHPWFGTPFHVTERLPGRVFQDWEPAEDFDPSREGLVQVYAQAVDALAAIHRVPADALPISAEPRRTPGDEVRHWSRILRKARPGSYLTDLDDLRDALLDRTPATTPGLVHGDFRGGNLVFSRGRLMGVIDWEVSGLGPQDLDLAWLLLFLDANRWFGHGPGHASDVGGELVERYRELTGRRLASLSWYMALARFRWSAIILFNLMLHESGKRTDALFDLMKRAVPILLQDARWSLAEKEILCTR